MIAIHAGHTLAECRQHYAEFAMRRPETCPACHVAGRMIGHGSYPRRKPLDATAAALQPVRVRRWRCTACKVTTSVLPDLFHRQGIGRKQPGHKCLARRDRAHVAVDR